MAARPRPAEPGDPAARRWRRRVSDWLARWLQRLAGAAGRASVRLSAGSAPVTPPDRPDGPPEHWLAVVRERAPQLLEGLGAPGRTHAAGRHGPGPAPAAPLAPVADQPSTTPAGLPDPAVDDSAPAPSPAPAAGVPRRLVTSISLAAKETLRHLARRIDPEPSGGPDRIVGRPAVPTGRWGRGRPVTPSRSRAVPDRRRPDPRADPAPEPARPFPEPALPSPGPALPSPEPVEGQPTGTPASRGWVPPVSAREEGSARQAQGTEREVPRATTAGPVVRPAQRTERAGVDLGRGLEWAAVRHAHETVWGRSADLPERVPVQGRWPELPDPERLLGADLWQPARPEFTAARIARLDDEQRGG